MPKKSEQLAGGFDAENTGGLLTGLLAEEENFDRRAMLRLGTWGVVSVGAVIVAVLANQSATKTRRDEVAALDLTRQSMQISAIAKESQNEARRLASAIDTLNNDRDRMYARLAGVEQGLESVTGAIAKQKSGPAPSLASTLPAIPTVVTPPTSSQPASAQQSVASAPAEPAPAVAPVTTTFAAALAAERARAEAKKSSPPATTVATAPPTPAAAPSPLPTPSPSPAASAAPATTSAMPVVPRTAMAPPDPMTPKLVEPVPAAKPLFAAPTPVPTPAPAAAPSQAPAAAAPAPQAATTAPAPDKSAALDKTTAAAPAAAPIEVKHTEFGVDVGGANSVAGLRALWRGLLKYRSNAPLAALQPIIVVKEANNGLGMQLRLVAGPLSDAAAAARICATIGSRDRGCETTVYDGQRLAVKTDDAQGPEQVPGKPVPEKPGDRSSVDKPGADKPSAERASDRDPAEAAPEKPVAKPGSNRYFHRRSSFVPAKRTAAVIPPPPIVEEAPKPEPSGLSSFFNRVHPQPQPQQQ